MLLLLLLLFDCDIFDFDSDSAIDLIAVISLCTLFSIDNNLSSNPSIARANSY